MILQSNFSSFKMILSSDWNVPMKMQVLNKIHFATAVRNHTNLIKMQNIASSVHLLSVENADIKVVSSHKVKTIKKEIVAKYVIESSSLKIWWKKNKNKLTDITKKLQENKDYISKLNIKRSSFTNNKKNLILHVKSINWIIKKCAY